VLLIENTRMNSTVMLLNLSKALMEHSDIKKYTKRNDETTIIKVHIYCYGSFLLHMRFRKTTRSKFTFK
jgi:hypothetical protein